MPAQIENGLRTLASGGRFTYLFKSVLKVLHKHTERTQRVVATPEAVKQNKKTGYYYKKENGPHMRSISRKGPPGSCFKLAVPDQDITHASNTAADTITTGKHARESSDTHPVSRNGRLT